MNQHPTNIRIVKTIRQRLINIILQILENKKIEKEEIKTLLNISEQEWNWLLVNNYEDFSTDMLLFFVEILKDSSMTIDIAVITLVK